MAARAGSEKSRAGASGEGRARFGGWGDVRQAFRQRQAPFQSLDVAAELLAVLVPLSLDEDAEPDAEPLSEEPADSTTLRLLPLLKSVSYQPPPLSRKPAADTSRFSVGCPQAGQNFCASPSMARVQLAQSVASRMRLSVTESG